MPNPIIVVHFLYTSLFLYICTIFALSLQYLCTIFAKSLPFLCTIFALSLFYLCTIFAMSLHCFSTIFVISLHFLCTIFALSLNCLCTTFANTHLLVPDICLYSLVKLIIKFSVQSRLHHMLWGLHICVSRFYWDLKLIYHSLHWDPSEWTRGGCWLFFLYFSIWLLVLLNLLKFFYLCFSQSILNLHLH